ncbi:MAG: glycerophosphodiester phosphodiesterase family protein [Stackebrandtia sp.]
MSRNRWLPPFTTLAFAALAVGVGFAAVSAAPAQAEDRALPPCPEVFTHGGYPTGPDGWERDQVRQPNNPTALQAYKDVGSKGVEADLQLTRDGHKAVMWHNGSTYWLTGSHKNVTDIWWASGPDQMSGRTIETGPFEGETVYSLRQYLDSLHEKRMVPLIEIKPSSAQSLLHSDAGIRDGAWAEVLDPIAERIERQEIMVYTHDDAIRPEMNARFEAAGLEAALSSNGNGPVWPDTVAWEEPPPSADGNHDAWQAALDKAPSRIATSWPAELSDWLTGKCE